MWLLVLWPAVSHNTGRKNFTGEDSGKMEKKSQILLQEDSHTGVSWGKSPEDLLTEAHGLGLLSNN